MAIKFKVHETPQPKGREGKALQHARAVASDTKKMDDICTLICARSSVSSADVKAVLDSFVWIIGLNLQHGDHVELEDLGHFSPSLRTRKLPDGKMEISVDGVNFRCSEAMKKQLKRATLEKESTLPHFTRQKRKERMLSYIDENDSITVPTYGKINACSRYKAQADLLLFINEGLIVRVGSGTHVMYLLAGDEK